MHINNTPQGGHMQGSTSRHFVCTARLRTVAVLINAVALTGLAVSQIACSSQKTVKWSEEVQLSNGQMIVVERETQHRPGGGELFRGSGWRPQQYVIRFKYPPNSEQVIEWRSTKMDGESAREPEYPLLLDIETPNGRPTVISFHHLRGACYEYLRYTYLNGAWTEDPLPAEFEARESNLYLPAAGLDLPGKVSLELKRKENADIRYSIRFKKIGPKQMDCRA